MSYFNNFVGMTNTSHDRGGGIQYGYSVGVNHGGAGYSYQRKINYEMPP